MPTKGELPSSTVRDRCAMLQLLSLGPTANDCNHQVTPTRARSDPASSGLLEFTSKRSTAIWSLRGAYPFLTIPRATSRRRGFPPTQQSSCASQDRDSAGVRSFILEVTITPPDIICRKSLAHRDFHGRPCNFVPFMFAFIAAPPAPTPLAANGSALVAPSRAPPHGQDMLVFCFAARQRAEQFRKRFDGGEFLGPKDRPNWPGARQATCTWQPIRARAWLWPDTRAAHSPT